MTVDVRAHRLGATVRVAARPGAQRSAVLGEHGGALKLAVAARPEKGQANREALRCLARALAVARSDLELLSGASVRDKVVLVRNLGAGALLARIEGLLSKAEV